MEETFATSRVSKTEIPTPSKWQKVGTKATITDQKRSSFFSNVASAFSKTLTIGVPCREEGQDFVLFACSLRDAIRCFSPSVPVEVIFCVNGSSEKFQQKLECIVNEIGLGTDFVRIIVSEEGKLNALRAIAENRTYTGCIAFVDSDVVLGRNVLRLLWEALENDFECKISYAQPLPVFPRKMNQVQRILRVHYVLRKFAHRRAYFHGRAFMLREWFFDAPQTIVDPCSATAKRLRLADGALVDDIAMSRMAVARWGKRAIREVSKARVHFDPPDSVRSLYAGALRVALEVRRLDYLYPRHSHLQKNIFRKVWHPEGLKGFSWRVRALHGIHRILQGCLGLVAQVHVYAVTLGILHLNALWIPVPGTKLFERYRKSWRECLRPYLPQSTLRGIPCEPPGITRG